MKVANKVPVSLIIPVGESLGRLFDNLQSLRDGSVWPSQIILINATPTLIDINSILSSFFDCCPESFSSIIELHSSHVKLYPGAARNLGIQHATCQWIAFLDVNTIPSESWLYSSFETVEENCLKLLLGATRYRPTTFFQSLVVQATFGLLPLQTLPGTLIHLSVINQIGYFLPNVRAGEDTDWLLRLRNLGFASSSLHPSPLTYASIPPTITALWFKWYRNYRSCASVVFHLEFQKALYAILFNFIFLLLAFRWNAIAAGWRQSSLLYVDNITKIVCLLLLFMYFSVRGFIRPMSRGSSFSMLFPFQWLAIGLICLSLDLTKSFAFLLSARMRFFL